jgi:hypothetical protein
MFDLFFLGFGGLVRLCRSRANLALENLALRQQLAALKRHHPRPRLALLDKLFWVAASRFWSKWKQFSSLSRLKQWPVGSGPAFACIGS